MCCCVRYLVWYLVSLILLILLSVPLLFLCYVLFVTTDKICYLELFVDSVSVSAAVWNVSMVATSPVTGCKVSITALNSRLLLGDKVIAESTAVENFKNLPDETATELRFTTTMTTDKLNGSSGDVVYWNARIELLSHVRKTDHVWKTGERNNGFLTVTCDHLPVRFWSDPEGNSTKGSLYGKSRRCDSLFRGELDQS